MTVTKLPDLPLLETERLHLRSIQTTDVADVFILRNDREHNQYLDRKKAESVEDAENYIEMIMNKVQNNETLFWAIELKETKEFSGVVMLWLYNSEVNKLEIGYELLPSYKGKGIMTEALKAVLQFAFSGTEVTAIMASVHKENKASIKLLTQLQFKASPDEDGKEYHFYKSK